MSSAVRSRSRSQDARRETVVIPVRASLTGNHPARFDLIHDSVFVTGLRGLLR